MATRALAVGLGGGGALAVGLAGREGWRWVSGGGDVRLHWVLRGVRSLWVSGRGSAVAVGLECEGVQDPVLR